MQNILEEIVANKRIEVEQAKLLVSLDELKKAADSAPPVRSLRKSIESHHEGGIIAEFKRRSPSKDWINRHAKVEDVIPSYEKAGAAGLSILTDHNYFGGTLQDVVKARSLTHLPILRKEFVVDAYQLYEARAAGADACLLIAAAIGAEHCHELAMVAHNIGLEVILEIHQAEELEAFSHNVDIVGVNGPFTIRSALRHAAQGGTANFGERTTRCQHCPQAAWHWLQGFSRGRSVHENGRPRTRT